jgi:hypothetical protein
MSNLDQTECRFRFSSEDVGSVSSYNAEFELESISKEFDHTCVHTPFTERAKCGNCITTEEARLQFKHYTSKTQPRKYPCHCDLQEKHTVYVCNVCDEVNSEIKHFQSEIVRACSRHGFEVSQSFIVNPIFQDTIERFAFRCRMLQEFLLRQRIKMSSIDATSEGMNEIFDVTNDISVLTFDKNGITEEDNLFENGAEENSFELRSPEFPRTPSASRPEFFSTSELDEIDSEAIYDYSITIQDRPFTLDDLNISGISSTDTIFQDEPLKLSDLDILYSSGFAIFGRDEVSYENRIFTENVVRRSKLYGFPADKPMTLNELDVSDPEFASDETQVTIEDAFRPLENASKGEDGTRGNSRQRSSSEFDANDEYEYDNLCKEIYTREEDEYQYDNEDDEYSVPYSNRRLTIDDLDKSTYGEGKLNELIYLFAQLKKQDTEECNDYEIPVIE